MTMNNSSMLFKAVALLVLLTWVSPLIHALSSNYQKVMTFKALMSINLIDVIYSDALQDGIPDDWSVEAWGGARETYEINRSESYSGNCSAMIEHTNRTGAATLTQHFSVSPQSTLRASVYTKGNSGAIRIQFWDATNKTWSGGVIQEIHPGNQWRQTSVDLTVPPGANTARILLYSDGGLILFDDVYVGLLSGETLRENILKNPGFEEDGIIEDPVSWWQTHVTYQKLVNNSFRQENSNLAYMNIADIIRGNLRDIQTRAQQLDESCANHPEMNSYLLSLGNRFRKIGGAAAEERLYQLAVYLTPNCPGPYASLAKLYKEHKSYRKASILFSKASELSAGTPPEGKYAFEAGFIDWTYTGALESAINKLEKAAALEGWQPSPWYKGAALFYLARSLEEIGSIGEAIQVYQRLLDCAVCIDFQMEAKNRLNQIITKQEGN